MLRAMRESSSHLLMSHWFSTFSHLFRIITREVSSKRTQQMPAIRNSATVAEWSSVTKPYSIRHRSEELEVRGGKLQARSRGVTITISLNVLQHKYCTAFQSTISTVAAPKISEPSFLASSRAATAFIVCWVVVVKYLEKRIRTGRNRFPLHHYQQQLSKKERASNVSSPHLRKKRSLLPFCMRCPCFLIEHRLVGTAAACDRCSVSVAPLSQQLMASWERYR